MHADQERGSDGSLPALWLASAVAVGGGTSDGHERAKESLRSGDSAAGDSLYAAARETANGSGMGDALTAAADSIGFAAED